MSYFAFVPNIIDSKGIVDNVIAIEQEQINTGHWGHPACWFQTSYNTKGGIHYDPATGQPSADQSKALRKNYAGIGFTLDLVRDAFIPPQDYPSWVLNEFSCLWEAPIPMPTDGKLYRWDEPTLSWVEIVVPTI